MATLAAAVQEATGETVALAFVDQGCTRVTPVLHAADYGIRLEVVRLADPKRGFVLLPRRRVVERSFARATRFRRLAKDDERLPETVAELHFVTFACPMLHRVYFSMIRSRCGEYAKRTQAGPHLDNP